LGSSVLTNKQGWSHKGSNATATNTAPDVCLTQVGNAVVPIPYPNIAKSSDLSGGAKTVKVDGQSAAIDGCCYSKSVGDDAGNRKGVASGTHKDKAEFINTSNDVYCEGKGVGRNTDAMKHNNGNTVGMNTDSSAAPPVDKLQTEKSTFKVKIVEHLCWDSWEKNKKKYLVGHDDNKPIKDLNVIIRDSTGGEHKKKTDEKGEITIEGLPRHANCNVTWKGTDSKLNNSYYWFYRQRVPIKLVGEKYPNPADSKNLNASAGGSIKRLSREERKQQREAELRKAQEDTKHIYEYMATEPMPKDNPKGNPVEWTVTKLPVGQKHVISLYRPPVIIDSHMHIESARCMPMPDLWGRNRGARALMALWAKMPVLGQKYIPRTRFVIENLDKIAKNGTAVVVKYSGVGLLTGAGVPPADSIQFMEPIGQKAGEKAEKAVQSVGAVKSGILGQNSTFKIGKEYIKTQQEVLNEFESKEEYKDRPLFMLGMLMTMDMEFAHLDGYFGIKIYNGIYRQNDVRQEDPVHYWYPCHGVRNALLGKAKDFALIEQNPFKPDKTTVTLEELGKDFKPLQKEIQKDGVIMDHGPGLKPRQIKIEFTPRLIHDEETKKYEPWNRQVKETELTVLTNPLKVIPLYHYDPRRWEEEQRDRGGNSHGLGVDESGNSIGNQEPMTKVRGGFYAGFKMYTAQGYKPFDIKRLPILNDFYRQCTTFDIPIMNHCTPDGAYTYDRTEYLTFRHPDDNGPDEDQSKVIDPEYYFNKQFVSPEAWKPVLEKWPNLRLCLAHYGGDKPLGRKWGEEILKMMKTRKYPNLYSDISSSFGIPEFRDHFKKVIQANKHLRSRILFGTDWYMTVMDNVDYMKFCKEAKDFLDSFDTGLWVRFTLINPIKFYKLDQQNNIDRIVNNIVETGKRVSEDDKLKYGLKGFSVKEDEIHQKAAYIKRAYEIQKVYWETPENARR